MKESSPSMPFIALTNTFVFPCGALKDPTPK